MSHRKSYYYISKIVNSYVTSSNFNYYKSLSLDLISKMNLAQFIRMKFAYKGVDKINLFITNIYVFDIFENKDVLGESLSVSLPSIGIFDVTNFFYLSALDYKLLGNHVSIFSNYFYIKVWSVSLWFGLIKQTVQSKFFDYFNYSNIYTIFYKKLYTFNFNFKFFDFLRSIFYRFYKNINEYLLFSNFINFLL